MVRERYQSADEVISEMDELLAISLLPSSTVPSMPVKPVMSSASVKKSRKISFMPRLIPQQPSLSPEVAAGDVC